MPYLFNTPEQQKEMLKIIGLAARYGAQLMPHSPYFGPGYLASLQIGAVLGAEPLFEYLYVRPQAQIYADLPLPRKGRITVPTSPGLGIDPDPDVLRQYCVR